jgi:hypothetical protein
MTMTIDDDAALREAFAARTGPGPGGPGACPAPERIYDAARGALPPGDVREVVEHLAVCPECAEAWRLAAALEEEAREEGAAEAVFPGASRRPWYLQPLRVAATVALALVAVAVVWTVVQAPEEAPVWRGDGELEIRSLLPEGEALPRADAVLRWTPVPEDDPEGTTYDLRVTTEDVFTSVAEADGLEEPRYTISPEALEDIVPGTELLWRVEARLEDGRTVASQTFTTAVR